MTIKRRVSVAIRQNEGYQCDVPGCTAHRTSLSHWCHGHHSAYQRNGHPTAGPVKASLWTPYRPRVRALLEANAAHPGVSRALAWLQQWIDKAAALDGMRGQQWAAEVARVKRHGCGPMEVLAELAACWCALQEHPRATVDDSHRAWALSKAVLSLAPRPRRVSPEAAMAGGTGYSVKARPSALRHTGPHLVQALAPLLANLHQSLQQEEERARAEADLMRQPLAPSKVAVARAVAALRFPSPTE